MSAEDKSARTSASPVGADSASAELPDLAEIRSWAGAKVEEIGGASIGKVEGAYADAEGEHPTWLMVRMGRFGHRSVVPVAHAVEAGGKVWVPYERDHVRAAPRIEPGAELNREQELELCSHFEIPETAGRGAEVAGRTPGTVTAKPVAS